jgi:hypothetical protein
MRIRRFSLMSCLALLVMASTSCAHWPMTA